MECLKVTCQVRSEHSIVWPDEALPLSSEFSNKVVLIPDDSNRERSHSFGDYFIKPIGFTAIVKDLSLCSSELEQIFKQGLKLWGLTLDGKLSWQVGTFFNVLFGGSTMSYSTGLMNKLQDINLTELRLLDRGREFFHESLAPSHLGGEDALEMASETRFQNDLSHEIDRIFSKQDAGAPSRRESDLTDQADQTNEDSPAPETNAIGAVTYFIRGMDSVSYRPVMNCLTGALLQVGRLRTGHIFEIDVDQVDSDRDFTAIPVRHSNFDAFLNLFNQSLLDVFVGGTVVIKYGALDRDGTYNQRAYGLLKKLMDLLHPALGRLQVIFVVPEDNTDVEKRIERQFSGPCVSLSKDSAPDPRLDEQAALEYLKDQVRSFGYEPDESLNELFLARIQDQSDFSLDELGRQYLQERWIEQMPQYANAARFIDPVSAENRESAEDRLASLIGLEQVKEHIHDHVARFRMNKKVAAAGLPVQPLSMHAAFLGAPGTGKTEVANLYAQILKDEGILSEGRLVSVSAGSAGSVQDWFDAAKGSVLFIDEAYAMLNKVTPLIALMEQRRNDTVVILAGYEQEMNMLFDFNPGFRSRLGVTLHFPDYTSEQLFEIFQLMVHRAQLELSESALKDARHYLARQGRREDQGNARFVRKFFEDVIGRQQVRLAKETADTVVDRKALATVLPEDILAASNGSAPEARERVDSVVPGPRGREQLESMVGLPEVKKMVGGYLDFQAIQKQKRDRGLPTSSLPMHMAFTGNPGTGKTAVARLVAKILKEEGVLSIGDCIECGRQDLVSPIVGLTAPKVHSLFRKARGSVLFIDEAYSLLDAAPNGPGAEAITTIVDDMEKFREEVVVILAGYTEEIGFLLDSNPGFKSRIQYKIEFPNYTADELVQILHLFAQNSGIRLAEGVDVRVRSILADVLGTADFGNARFIRSLFERAQVTQSSRLVKDSAHRQLNDQDMQTLLPDDFQPLDPPKKRVLGFQAI